MDIQSLSFLFSNGCHWFHICLSHVYILDMSSRHSGFSRLGVVFRIFFSCLCNIQTWYLSLLALYSFLDLIFDLDLGIFLSYVSMTPDISHHLAHDATFSLLFTSVSESLLPQTFSPDTQISSPTVGICPSPSFMLQPLGVMLACILYYCSTGAKSCLSNWSLHFSIS